MNLSIKDISIAIAVAGSLVYLFTNRLPWARDYVLQDRQYAEVAKKAAIVELRSCYADAEATYNSNWARACKLVNEQKLNQCYADGVPRATCESKIIYSSDCDLPAGRADRADSFRDSLKQECRSMFSMETK